MSILSWTFVESDGMEISQKKIGALNKASIVPQRSEFRKIAQLTIGCLSVVSWKIIITKLGKNTRDTKTKVKRPAPCSENLSSNSFPSLFTQVRVNRGHGQRVDS